MPSEFTVDMSGFSGAAGSIGPPLNCQSGCGSISEAITARYNGHCTWGGGNVLCTTGTGWTYKTSVDVSRGSGADAVWGLALSINSQNGGGNDPRLFIYRSTVPGQCTGQIVFELVDSSGYAFYGPNMPCAISAPQSITATPVGATGTPQQLYGCGTSKDYYSLTASGFSGYIYGQESTFASGVTTYYFYRAKCDGVLDGTYILQRSDFNICEWEFIGGVSYKEGAELVCFDPKPSWASLPMDQMPFPADSPSSLSGSLSTTLIKGVNCKSNAASWSTSLVATITGPQTGREAGSCSVSSEGNPVPVSQPPEIGAMTRGCAWANNGCALNASISVF